MAALLAPHQHVLQLLHPSRCRSCSTCFPHLSTEHVRTPSIVEVGLQKHVLLPDTGQDAGSSKTRHQRCCLLSTQLTVPHPPFRWRHSDKVGWRSPTRWPLGSLVPSHYDGHYGASEIWAVHLLSRWLHPGRNSGDCSPQPASSGAGSSNWAFFWINQSQRSLPRTATPVQQCLK